MFKDIKNDKAENVKKQRATRKNKRTIREKRIIIKRRCKKEGIIK